MKMMMKKNSNGYVPNPMKYDPDSLPEGILVLVEKLAENIHEVWALQKMTEGWSYGPILNPSAKQHPSLKPYPVLDETQKDYDRNTAMATLADLIKNGYEIVKKI
jgi:hypothetical protein